MAVLVTAIQSHGPRVARGELDWMAATSAAMTEDAIESSPSERAQHMITARPQPTRLAREGRVIHNAIDKHRAGG